MDRWVTQWQIPAVLHWSVCLSWPWPCRSISRGQEDFIWWSAQLVSGCHIPRWHVVTGPSGHACCQKQTDPLHSEGQGQSWDRPVQTRPSKLSQKSHEASEGPDVLYVNQGLAVHIIKKVTRLTRSWCFAMIIAFWELLVLERYFSYTREHSVGDLCICICACDWHVDLRAANGMNHLLFAYSWFR